MESAKKMKQTTMDNFITSPQREKDKNRENLKAAIETIKCCGRVGSNLQNIDPETYEVEKDDDYGCFVGLVKMVIQIHTTGNIHLLHKAFSTENLESIIEVFVPLIRNIIVERVNSSSYYSIFTVRVGDPVDMAVLFARYLHKNADGKLCVRQDFLGFIKDEFKRGEKFEDRLKNTIDGYGLDLQKMRGFVHDYMDDRLTGGVIDAIYTQALCTGNYAKSEKTLMHLMFSSPTFNFNVYMLYKYFSDVGKYIWRIFGGSHMFLEKLEGSPHLVNGKRLMKELTSENQVFFSDVRKVLFPIISTIRQLDEEEAYPKCRMIGSWDWFSTEPAITSCQIQSFEFIAVAFIFDSVVAHVTNISKDLHKPNVDLVALMKRVDVTINGLAKAREESEGTFKPIFEAICNFCDQHSIEKDLDTYMMSCYEDIDVSDSSVLEKFVREFAYESLLDGVIDQLKMRFNERYRQAVLCQRLIPSFIGGTDDETSYCESLESVLMLYEKDIDMKVKVLDEIKKWWQHWLNIPIDERPKDVVQTLCFLDEDESFMNIKTLLQIFAILPMASVKKAQLISDIPAFREHFESAAWNHLRHNGLALLYFHRDIEVDTDKVIQLLVESGKLDFTV